jgi:NifB/MoaA-like Fe-S oxidoreductase
VVPVGLTKYHRGDCRVLTLPEMRAVFQQVLEWQARLREDLGAAFVYLSDEWYLRLDEAVPPLAAYDGHDLTENGVGLVRRFLDGFRAQAHLKPDPLTLVTGTLFTPLLRSLVADSPAEVIPVVNRFFGETVTVAGLLTAQDVIEQLRARRLNAMVVLPAAMFGGPEGQSLDEMWPEDVAAALDRPVKVGAQIHQP